MWILHLGKPVNITVLDEERAIDLGSSILGETTIFLTIASLLIYEYNRSYKKEIAVEEEKDRELRKLYDAVTDLHSKREEQAALITELANRLRSLEGRVFQTQKLEEQQKDTSYFFR